MGPGSTSPEPPRDVGQGWNPWPKGVLRSWLCLHVPAERGGSTPGGSPFLPIFHTSQESCLQLGEQSLHVGLAKRLEFSRREYKAMGRRPGV